MLLAGKILLRGACSSATLPRKITAQILLSHFSLLSWHSVVMGNKDAPKREAKKPKKKKSA
jgi:hypothetical protein